MGLFGILLKVLYVKFREGILQGAFYVLAAVYAAQIFLQSIQSWPYMLTVLVFALCVILSSSVFIKRS
jgi:predicted Kef-type K+ transport protein